ncbi:isoquinoline 1-oxidoreductase maturation factor [Psychromonas ingrahamii 37]|uniref:Isoquinoline 1-oxidoreductase maturation factor n=1 Tax=Psychromonas ingrahamii (strain DSM 17664 / CCUG 51855 / 37) TaxID=357804 RepID=A1SVU6_PSYIN|nr:XdhC/CoxI family protein [Psychromonas ingrahamii]ABM03611.1 isoquinoline 1-oxidoreductase maturation factor [Psychromonas ingrahamii 37]
MSHHIEDLLSQWNMYPNDKWVLAVITKIQGSSYRKTGAMMLFHALGKSIGLVSGGCLEGDLLRHAQRAIQQDQAINITYDATDESDASYQLGCGGIVDLLLIPVTADNNYLHLQTLMEQLKSENCEYHLPLVKSGTQAASISASVVPILNKTDYDFSKSTYNKAKESSDITILQIPCRTRFHLAIFGGGLDAQPLTMMAIQLGWKVTVFDERSSYAHQHHFPKANIIKQPLSQLENDILLNIDGVVVMQHNLTLDALALKLISQSHQAYIALLGPRHRRDQVFSKANINLDDFKGFFSAPAGFDIGGELPESIALSILAECHAVFYKRIH